MNKEIRVCSCGSIHLIEDSIIREALEEDKELLLVCAHCGRVVVIGADIEELGDRVIYNRYTKEFDRDRSLTLLPSEFKYNKEVYYIIYDKGILVPMMTGEYANSYNFGKFMDMIYPDFMELEATKMTREDTQKFIDKYRKNRVTVDMNRLIHENTPEVLTELSKLYIKQFDWTDTPYATSIEED